jgi:hypothetical protein
LTGKKVWNRLLLPIASGSQWRFQFWVWFCNQPETSTELQI